MRRSGILLPVSSIPGKYGIGSFSKESYEFVDFLKKANQKLWQILPLGPTGYGDSPYQSFSTFAGNPYFIDLEELIEKGLLTKEECNAFNYGEERVDYAEVYNSRKVLLKKAYERSNIGADEEFQALKDEIERIGTTTQFNGQNLLDGHFDLKGYSSTDAVSVDYYSDTLVFGKYTIEDLQPAYETDADGYVLLGTITGFRKGLK